MKRKDIEELHTGPQQFSDNPRVKDLEKQITRFENRYDYLSFEKKKVDFKKEINDICLNETPKPESCEQNQEIIVEKQRGWEVKITNLTEKIHQTTEEINSLLTDDQKTRRDR